MHAFPRYLEATIEGADDPASRAELQCNLADELSRPKAHHELWLDFADALGLDRYRVATAPPTPFARATVETFERLTSRDVASGLAALYAYESQQPEVSRRKMGGLRESYGVRSAKGLAYFEVHATTDLQHREGERNALARCLDGGASHEVVLNAATDALDAYWGLLDGICDEAAFPPLVRPEWRGSASRCRTTHPKRSSWRIRSSVSSQVDLTSRTPSARCCPGCKPARSVVRCCWGHRSWQIESSRCSSAEPARGRDP